MNDCSFFLEHKIVKDLLKPKAILDCQNFYKEREKSTVLLRTVDNFVIPQGKEWRMIGKWICKFSIGALLGGLFFGIISNIHSSLEGRLKF